MTGRYQAYPEYKKSGVNWLESIPVHWEVRPLKYLSSCNDEVINEKTAPDHEVEYVDIGSVSAVDGISKTEKMVFGSAPSRARRKVKDGDVIVSTVRTYLEAIAPITNPPENMLVSTGFAVIRPNSNFDKGFASYCLRARGFIEEVVTRSVGVSYPAINSTDLINIKTPLIPINEQQKIANFLDHETAKTDTLIAKQEKLIELLKEKRQAVISHAVTRGLNPDIPMKDSGVEWLGEVPKHWGIGALKHIVKQKRNSMVDGPFGSSVNTTEDYVDEGIPVVRTVNITNKGFNKENLMFMREAKFRDLDRHAVYPNDVLFSKVGTIGNACLLPIDVPEAILSTTGSCKITVEEHDYIPSFLVWVIQSMNQQLMLIANSNVQPFLNMSNIKNLTIPMPPVREQKEIIETTITKLEIMDEAIIKSGSLRSVLKERKTALISAAVTGKIDVRDWQARIIKEEEVA
ncbi:restriction endonuclease subunit S [Colwellia demingiae]|uniref:Restriction endonuclease subunit S n=1 Tax=Colwellia demingiae TaxID=89401 RepID=A0A5C6QAT8_9GAMM|nr:restriction endonuclease subunit S [Colwellia demingiae]TWX65938.1 restriction endonuclease subunit S [Colwellia demingiae]